MGILFSSSIQTVHVPIARSSADVNHCKLYTAPHDVMPGMTYIRFIGRRAQEADLLMFRRINKAIRSSEQSTVSRSPAPEVGT